MPLAKKETICPICEKTILIGSEYSWSFKQKKSLGERPPRVHRDCLPKSTRSNSSGSAPASISEAQIRRMVDEALRGRSEPRTYIVQRPDASKIKIENPHKQFATLLDLMCAGVHVYAWGAPGGGKSTAAKQVAKALGLKFGYISLDEQSPDYLLMGYKDANGKYHRTVFRDCYEKGGVFVIEELDNASGSLLTSLNCALENGHCAFPDGMVKMHENFRLIGAGNTSGRGAHRAFPERRPFDAAFADRFFYMEWLYDTDLEYSIAAQIDSDSRVLVDWVIAARAHCDEYSLPILLTPRSSFRLAKLSRLPNLSTEQLIDGVLKGVDETLREKLLTAVPFPSEFKKAVNQ